MNGVKANSRIWVENTRLWRPSISQLLHSRPRQVVLLAPTDPYGPPEPDHPMAECGETVDISRYCVVVEVALHDGSEPFGVPHHRFLHAPTKPLLDFLQLSPHPLADRLAPHHIAPIPVLPANLREPQKIERLGFTFSSLVPVDLGIPPELNPARFVGCSSSPNFRSRSRSSSRKRSASSRCWKPSTL